MRRMKNSLNFNGKEGLSDGSPLTCAFLLTRTAAVLTTHYFRSPALETQAVDRMAEVKEKKMQLATMTIGQLLT